METFIDLELIQLVERVFNPLLELARIKMEKLLKLDQGSTRIIQLISPGSKTQRTFTGDSRKKSTFLK